MIWGIIAGGLIVFYIGWYIALTSWSRLRELGIENERHSATYFDTIMWSFIFSVIIARIVWMLMNYGVYSDVPWGIFPYVRTVSSIDWFTFFPWRYLRFTEGVYYPVLWGLTGLFSSVFIYLPTMSLARKLKLEKRGIMRGFLLKSLFGFGLTVLYFGILVWYSVL